MGKKKYTNILTQDFLKQEYTEKKKSLNQLSKENKVYITTIRKYIVANNIRLRTHKEQAAISSPGGKLKYKDILTKEFFIQNYINSRSSVKNLAVKIGIDRSVVHRYSKRLKIPIRSFKEQINLSYPPKEFNLTEECISFFDGLLLGDGSIPFRKSGCRSYTQSCKYEEYLKYIEKRAEKLGITCSPINSRWTNDSRCKNKGYFESLLQSHRYKTFEILRKRWYNRRKKVIPEDVRINRDSMLQFYLGDGSFYRNIILCTNGFRIKELKILQTILNKKLHILTKITKDHMLVLKKSDSFKFIKYIGKSPVQCYQYKWHDNESKEKKLEKNRRAREVYHAKKRTHLRLSFPSVQKAPL